MDFNEASCHSDFMRSRLTLLIATGCALALVVLGLLLWRTEPSYKGHGLATCVAILGSDGNEEEALRKAKEAIDHIGTNATPYLLAWIQFEPKPGLFRSRLANPYSWSGGPLSFRDRMLYTFRSQRERLAEGAAPAFEVLGARAIPAIPELSRLMNTRTNPITALRAGMALVWLGTNGLPALLAAIDDPEHQNRFVALMAIDLLSNRSRPSDERLVPHLIRCLDEDKDSRVPRLAASALGRLAVAPHLVVPALTNCFRSTDSRLRQTSAIALAEIGHAAATALPALTNALSDPDPEVKRLAGCAIETIASKRDHIGPAR
jgi:HEAT repeat protein